MFGKLLRALVTQAGVAIPTMVVHTNTLGGGTLTWARQGAGAYTLTSSVAVFLVNKTHVKGGVYDQATGKMLSGVRTSDTVLTFKHGIAAGAASDVFADVPLEVIVYE